MTIEEIYDSKDIGIRSFNVCNDNELKDLPAILKHYQENKTFDNLRNCGRKSNEELIALCLKYIGQENIGLIGFIKTENPLVSKVSNLTRTQREIVNSFIEINSNNLTNRCRNAIITFLNGNLKIRNFSEKVLANEQFNIQDIKNIGAKSIAELNSFIDLTKDFIENVSNSKDENDLVSLKNRFFIEKSFSISEIPNDVLESLSIFKLIDFLLSQNAIFEKNQNTIFQKAFIIYRNQIELNIDELAEELKLSKERIRQIRKSISENLFDNFQFVKNIEDDLFQKYKIDISQDFIFIDDNLSDFINESNGTNFSRGFISFLIYVYAFDKFTLIGNVDDVLLPKHFNSRKNHNWECFYLVDKIIYNVFQFNEFADDINKRLGERSEETYKLNFKSFLSNFLIDNNLDFLKQVTFISEEIMNNEFGLYLDLDDNLTFSRNSVKQAYEYAYEALKQIGKPSKVNDITKKILELHSDYETDDAKVRASMKRQNGFIPIGRNSVFGLKIWESELENFKGGTIRSIVLEYLEQQLEPKRFSDITTYVLQFRPKSNEYSILQNLKLDESRNFLFFKNSYVGLSSKNYDKSFILVSNESTAEKKAWEERFSDLSQFLNQNGRLPFSSGCSESEIKLYRWYKVQVGKSREGNLDDEKSTLIKGIFDKYKQSTSRKRRTNVTEKYNELITFVVAYKRLPSARKIGEGKLYSFFYTQRSFYEQGKLKLDEENNFIKVLKIIQNS